MASGNDDSDKKEIRMADIQKQTTDKDKCIMVIDNRVYDITKFLDEVIHTIIRNKTCLYFTNMNLASRRRRGFERTKW